MDIVHYTTEDGTDLYQEWVDALRDSRARIVILRRVDRVAVTLAITNLVGMACRNYA